MSVSADATAGNYATAFYITSGSNWTVKGARFWMTDSGAGTTGFVAYLLQGNSLATATQLATANFGTCAINAWNEVNFSSPVAISSGNKYWIAIYFPNGKYSFISHKFDTALRSVDLNNLYAAGTSEVTPGNGSYAYGSAGNMGAAATFNATFYGADVIADDGVNVGIAANLSLADSRRAYWLKTITTGGNLSNQDLFQAFLKAQPGMPANLSNNDMEKIYWNTKAGTSGLSIQDAKRITFGSSNQFSELLWLRAQP